MSEYFSERDMFLMKEALNAGQYYESLGAWLDEVISDGGHIVAQHLAHDANQIGGGWVKCSDALPEQAPKTRNNRHGILVRFDDGRIERFNEVTEFLVNFMRNGPRLPMKFETPVPARATHWMEITPPEQESE